MSDSNRGHHHRTAAEISAIVKRAGSNGRMLEEAVSATMAIHRADGTAKIRKSYPTGRASGGYGGVGGAAPVDFTGTFGERKVAFECKHITRAATYVHDMDRAHQLQYLTRARHHGGLAFLLLYDGDLRVAFICGDIAALLCGPVPVRNVARSGRYVAHLPTTYTSVDADGILHSLPNLLRDAEHHCAKWDRPTP